MTAPVARRDFLLRTGGAGLALGLAGNTGALFSSNPTAGAAGPRTGYGPLRRDPDGLLDLPPGFRYTVLSREGEPMRSGGGLVASRCDGMGAFAEPGTVGTRLVRNHECSPTAEHAVPHVDAQTYDPGASGGTSTLVLDRHLAVTEEFPSLGGTAINCSGGISPWGTWLTCEETEDRAGDGPYTRDHGWIFEVDPFTPANNRDPFPLTDMGRFMHEAVAVDPATGVVYETEDAYSGAPLGSFYRFLPNDTTQRYGALRAGGTLQALSAPEVEDLSLVTEAGTTFTGIEWLTVPDPYATTTPTRAQDYPRPITRGQKIEGCWWAPEEGAVYFVSSFARPEDGSLGAHDGQVWRYHPVDNTLTLTLIFTGSASDDDVFEAPDNMCVSPYGGLMICEDSGGENYLIGTTEDGEPFTFARNRQELKEGTTGELAGVCFSPDGRVMFFNVYNPGTTFAITGPWNRRRSPGR